MTLSKKPHHRGIVSRRKANRPNNHKARTTEYYREHSHLASLEETEDSLVSNILCQCGRCMYLWMDDRNIPLCLNEQLGIYRKIIDETAIYITNNHYLAKCKILHCKKDSKSHMLDLLPAIGSNLKYNMLDLSN